jgi:hypothetical protein
MWPRSSVFAISRKTHTSFARGVFLCTEEEGFSSDNYSGLFTGQKKIVTFNPQLKTDGFEKKLKIISLIDT